MAKLFTKILGEKQLGLDSLNLRVSVSGFGIGYCCTYKYQMGVPV